MAWDLSGVPVFGGLFDDPDQKRLERAYARAGQRYEQLAPLQAQAQMNSLGSVLAAYGPANAMLGQMVPGGSIPMDQVFRNPFPAGHPSSPFAGQAGMQVPGQSGRTSSQVSTGYGPGFGTRANLVSLYNPQGGR